MAISDVVARALNSSKHIHNLILELHPDGQFEGTVRNRLFHALCDLTTEHLGAIITLIGTDQHYGSAFALLRPLNESRLRAFWILYIADENKLESIATRKSQIPNFSTVRSEVEAYFANGGVSGIFTMGKDYISTLHGLTHSGMEQLVYRFDDDLRIKPTYPDLNVKNLLNQASQISVMAALVRIDQVEGSIEKLSQKTEDLQAGFLQIMGE